MDPSNQTAQLVNELFGAYKLIAIQSESLKTYMESELSALRNIVKQKDDRIAELENALKPVPEPEEVSGDLQE